MCIAREERYIRIVGNIILNWNVKAAAACKNCCAKGEEEIGRGRRRVIVFDAATRLYNLIFISKFFCCILNRVCPLHKSSEPRWNVNVFLSFFPFLAMLAFLHFHFQTLPLHNNTGIPLKHQVFIFQKLRESRFLPQIFKQQFNFFLPNCLKIINCWLIPAKNNADEFIPNGNKTIQILEIKRCSNICLINFADGIIMIYHYYMISLANYTIFSSILHDIVKRYLPHW